ncbi:cobalamin biosynthesis protein CbiD [Desulforamulus reducens MI-1]|uniref:Cobalt-precorrin-5B C(1)-methyltransferase n=1 Tax=Desulforamulus reducens (strain ATCC BAA-1160 / DSM 100696 / MI-1) TaxID=349161 RepID=A4J815_DESRM|nr:cobalt-precorrin-5B (C(1))-methyltransferase CbiD [Desulforamulus reducens]ABO51218.1 cobalamin biosynthesis protein CbiD [Desulforamulus reducens MI-1]
MQEHKEELKSGFTTGTCAAAAAKAAALALVKGTIVRDVSISLPGGGQVVLAISQVEMEEQVCRGAVVKDAGDDPDVTHGLTVVAEVSLQPGEIQITGGIGVGTVTKPGLAVPVGESAINPVPRQMIEQEVREILGPGQGAKIVISVPEGERVANLTMNPRLGIVGGISILGTGGIVRPMSEDAYRRSLVPQIDQALALGHRLLVLTPGRLGVKKAAELALPAAAVIETSNFIGTMLEECAKRPVEGVLLLGHLGKLVKVAAGIFHTLGKLADGRRETIAAHAALLGAPRAVIELLMNMNTAEEAVAILHRYGMSQVFENLSAAASQRAAGYVREKFRLGTVMYALSGEIVGYDEGAREIGEALGWKILSK